MMWTGLTRRNMIVGAAATAVASATAAATDGSTAVHDVAISSFAFDPPHLRVRVGDTIRWTNHDLAPHTATADQFGWDTGELAKGATGEVRVTKDMERAYFCVFHPHMKGTIDIL